MKDFVGARLEAEETLRKRQERGEPTSPQDTMAAEFQRWAPQEEQPQHQHLASHPSARPELPDSSALPVGSSDRLTRENTDLNATSAGLGPGEAYPAISDSPFAPVPAHELREFFPEPAASTTVPGPAAAAQACCLLPESSGIHPVSNEAETGSLIPSRSDPFPTLTRREKKLSHPVAILDDRMARARPTGPTAFSVSASAAVSTFSLGPRLSRGGSPGDASGVARSKVMGAEGGVGDGGVTERAGSAGQTRSYGYGRSRRRFSTPLVPLPVGLSGRKGWSRGIETGGEGGGFGVERKRPWTTPEFGGSGMGWHEGNEGRNMAPVR